MHILIAEDHPDIGVIMTKLIINSGHQASLATNGHAAVKLAGERPPQVILLDINMPPGIDGYETARILRKRYGNRFRIFAVTSAPIDVLLANRSGFDGIFAKPFDIRKLTALIAQMPESIL